MPTLDSLFSEDERLHLQMIQSVVARMSSASVSAKGWSLTIAVAVFGFAAGSVEPVLAVLGLVALIFFGLLDGHYLRQERLFRRLYVEACDRSVPVFSMDTTPYLKLLSAGAIVRSWAVLGFYGPLGAVGVAVLLWVATR